MRKSIVLLSLLLFVTACGPDPRKEAQAYQIQSQADQDALTSAQARQHAEDLHTIQVQQARLEEQHREATAQEWRAGLNKMIKFGFTSATVGLCVFLLALAYSFSYSSIGMAKAATRAADVRANLIMLDPGTRQFPLFVQHIHGNRFALHNPNVGSVIMLDMSNPADRQLIATAGATQLAGVIAQEASHSTDPAGVSIIQPTIVNVRDELITIEGNTRSRNE